MARPKTPQLTERELEVMHVFWEEGPLTAAQARDSLAAAGRDLAYTTVATLIKILAEKQHLEQTGEQRPYLYAAVKSFEEVSGSLVGDLVKRVFQGSREELLVRLLDGKKLSAKERRVLEDILKGGQR